MNLFSKKYPPKNRLKKGLPILHQEVSPSATPEGILILDPNAVAVAGCLENLPLGEPIHPSFLSGDKGYLFRSDDIEIALTKEELYRLFRLDLKPEEFKKIVNHFGSFFEIHDDFYNEDTGDALQPREGPSRPSQRARR